MEQPDAPPSVPAENKTAAVMTSASAKSSDDFLPVKELLSQRCAPCHNPGGKMYESLPFDSPEIVKSHSAPILQRLNTIEDKQIVEQWLSKTQS
jgi:uncharacterized membrane protein